MGWQAATDWADQLVFGGYDDWRLMSVKDDPQGGYDTNSEFGHLYFIDLGNTGSLTNTSFIDGNNGSTVSLINMEVYGYWNQEAASSFFWT